MHHEFKGSHVQFVLDNIMPAVESFTESGLLTTNAAIVVLQPNAANILQEHEKQSMLPGVIIENGTAKHELVVGSKLLGNISDWPLPYLDVAFSKALLTLRHGKPTRDIPESDREKGDTLFFGSAIVDNIIVAVSGFNPNYDEMLSYMIAYAIRGIAIVRTTPCFKK